MAETKTVNIRIPAEMAEYLEKKDMSINSSIVDCIEKVMYFEKYAMRDIKGVFTADEWKFLADSLNGTLVEGDYRYIGSALVAHIEDSEMYDGTASKYGVDVATMKGKIEKLSCGSLDAIYRRVDEFWKGDTPVDFDKWAIF